MIVTASSPVDEQAARRRHPTARPWRPDWARLATAVAARMEDEGAGPAEVRDVLERARRRSAGGA